MDKKKKKTVKSPKVTSPEIASSDRQDKITVGAAQPSGSGICRDIKELEHTATELALSEQKFRNLAEGSPNMIFINHRGRIVYANIRCSEIMKYRPEEFYDQGFDFMTLVAPEYQDLVKANFRKHMAGEDVPPHEYALITKEGKRIDSIINTSLIDYEGGKAILGVVTDITERRNAENKLRESEDKFRALFESATDGILILDLEQEQFLDGNKAICSMLGYTIEEVRSLRVRDIHPKQDLPAVIGILERQIRGEITLAKDIPVLRKDGSVFYADINATHVVMAGRPCIAGLFRDITDRKLAEEALRESEEKFRALFESAKDGVILLSMNGDVLALNASFAKMHGYTTEEMLQMNLKDLDTPESAQLASARLQRLFAGEPLTFDVEHYCKNGQTIPLEVSANLVNVHGKKYILGFHRDVTDRRLSEAALIESEERYRNVYNTAPLAFVLWDRETRVTDWNEQAERIFGWTREEIIGRNFFDYIIPASAHLHVEEVVKLLLEGKLPSYSINENITKSGRIIVCEWNNSVIRDSGGNIVGVISLGLDISERKRAEEALKESEERFKAITTTASDAIMLMDDNGKIVYWNPASERIFGYSAGEAMGKELHVLLAPRRMHGGYREGFARFTMTGQGPVLNRSVEMVAVKKDGTEFPIEVSTSPMNIGGRWHALGIVRDITERKRTEESLEESRQMLKTVIDTIPVRVFWKDRESKYLGCNMQFASDAGFESPEGLVGKDDFQMGWREQAELYRADDKQVLQSGIPKLNYEEPQTTPAVIPK